MSTSTASLAEVAVINPRFDRSSFSDLSEAVAFVPMAQVSEESGAITQEEIRPISELIKGFTPFVDRDVLVAKITPCFENGKIAHARISKRVGFGSTEFHVVRPDVKRLDDRYLFHFMRQPRIRIQGEKRMTGSGGQRRVPKAFLEGLELPLPSLDEQRRIAAILDKADALRAKRRETIAKLDRLLQSVFLDMFGDPVRNSREWPEAQTLGDIADIVSGITKGRKVRAATREVPYLAVSNVHDRVLKLDVVKLIEAADDEISRYSLRPNDLLLTEGGDPDKLGRGALWNGELPECIHQNHIFRVRLTSDALHPVYLSWLVGSERGKRYFAKQAKQTTGIASINMRQLRGFPLLVPPMNLQRRFAKVTRQIEKQRQRIERHRDQFDILLASLQHRAFTGTL